MRKLVRVAMTAELERQSVTMEFPPTLLLIDFYECYHLLMCERDKAANESVRHFCFVVSCHTTGKLGFSIVGSTVLLHCDPKFEVLERSAAIYARLRCFAEQTRELRDLATDLAAQDASLLSLDAASSLPPVSSSPTPLSSPALVSPERSVATQPATLSFVMPWSVYVPMTDWKDASPATLAKEEREFAAALRLLTALCRITKFDFRGSDQKRAPTSTATVTVGTSVPNPSASSVVAHAPPARAFRKRVCDIVVAHTPAYWRDTYLPDSPTGAVMPLVIIPAAANADHMRAVLMASSAFY
jgi:hypothetical protein